MLHRGLSAFMSFLLITPFTSLLNSSTSAYFLYLPSLTTLLNSCMNSFIVLVSCFTFLSLATLANLSLSFPNSLFSFAKKSPANSNYTSSTSIFSNKFSFQIFTNLLYIYVIIHCICSSIFLSLILILIYNLHTITKPTTFSSPLNKGSCATYAYCLVLGLRTISSPSLALSANTAICACITAICSAYYYIKSYNFSI